GSGISRSANIPTGWDVTCDLIRKIAVLYGEACDANEEAWFRRKFGEPPGYSKLLDILGKTATERNQLLRGYFEPTTDERERGEKMPTLAHKAIGQLVASGYIRVLVITNFDPVMEEAVRAVGVNPSRISTRDG